MNKIINAGRSIQPKVLVFIILNKQFKIYRAKHTNRLYTSLSGSVAVTLSLSLLFLVLFLTKLE